MQFKINLPDSLTVRVRGADPVSTPTDSIPADILARAVEYGWQQANADAASGAARAAVPAKVTEGLKGDKAEAAVKAWMKDEDNAEAIQAVRMEMIRDSINRKTGGEWKAARAAGGEAVSETEAETYRFLASAPTRKAVGHMFGDVYAVFDGFEKGMATSDRRAAILDAVESLDDARREWIAAQVKARLDAKAIELPDFNV